MHLISMIKLKIDPQDITTFFNELGKMLQQAGIVE